MNIALILAGGSGSRVNGELPKQFIKINNVPMLVHTVRCFKNHPDIGYICIVAPNEYTDMTQNVLSQYNENVDAVITGGNSRMDSSYNGIMYLAGSFSPEDIVLIHDAARPNVSKRIISENIEMSKKKGSAVTVIPVQDTVLKCGGDSTIQEYVNRNELYYVQTPQSFKLGVIAKAHEAIRAMIKNKEIDQSQITDDSKLLYLSGENVSTVVGDKLNIKVTTKEDFSIICNIMK